MSDKDFLIKLGASIKNVRTAKNWSQADLAYRVGMEKSNLSVIENGKSNPQVLTLAKLASAMDVTMAEIFDFEFDLANLSDDQSEYKPRKHKK